MHKTCEIMNSTCDMLINKLSLTFFLSDLSCVFSSSFSSFSLWFASSLFSSSSTLNELSFFLVYAQTATLIFKSFSQSVISFARFSALMLSSFINVSLCSVDAAHMHSRDLFDQMSIFLWSRLMLLTYASHRLRSFSNPTSSLECAGHMQFLKFNPTSRIFSNPGSTFPTPRRAAPPTRIF